MLQNQRGALTLEAIIVFSAIAAVLFTVLAVGYFSLAKTVIADTGYNALICLAKRKAKVHCSQIAVERIEQSLPFGALDHLHLNEYRGRFRVSIFWTFYSDKKIRYQKKLRY